MMRKAIYVLLSAVLAASMLTSCKKEEKPEDIVFKSAISSLTFNAEVSENILYVTTNIGVAVLSTPDWITAEYSASQPKSGDKLADTAVTVAVTLKASENSEHTDRSGEIVIGGSSRDGHTLKITVTQNQKPYSFSFTAKGTYLDAPKLTGSGLTGTINWGDGKKETYKSGNYHKFSGSGSHTVTVTVNSGTADKVVLESLSGVTKIDLSSF